MVASRELRASPHLHRHFQRPLVVAVGVVDDQARIDYLDSHLRAVATAIHAGVDVQGYYTWSVMDNWEWAEGFTQRFGLVYVDYESQQRIPKRSFDWYAETIRAQPPNN